MTRSRVAQPRHHDSVAKVNAQPRADESGGNNRSGQSIFDNPLKLVGYREDARCPRLSRKRPGSPTSSSARAPDELRKR
jgi:hypothetical protein